MMREALSFRARRFLLHPLNHCSSIYLFLMVHLEEKFLMSHVLRRALRALLATLCLASSTFTFAHQLQVEPVAIKIRPQSSFYTLEFTENVQDITQIPGVTKDIQCVQGNSFEVRPRAYSCTPPYRI